MIVSLFSGDGALAGDSAWHWEPFGPVGNTDGLVAIADDPTESDRFWIAGSSAVWVTNDGGETFRVVFEMSRGRGSARATHALDDDEDLIRDFDSFNPLDFDAANTTPDEPAFDDDLPADPWTDPLEATEPTSDPNTPEDVDEVGLIDVASTEEVSEDRLNPFIRGQFGITRLRVIGQDLWVCTSRGLWRVPRTARVRGSATEVPLGRRVGVNDVAQVVAVTVVATDAGLWRLGPGTSTRIRGIAYDVTVTALAQTTTHLFAGTASGLYRGDLAARRFALVGGGQRGGVGVTDVLTTGDRVLTANGREVTAYDGAGAGPATNAQVPGATRLFRDVAERIWAVGDYGPWRETAQGWSRFEVALGDRRLSDGAGGCDIAPCPPRVLRIVGAQGAWRAAPGRGEEGSDRAREIRVGQSLAERPSLAVLIAKAEAQRALSLGQIQTFVTRERLSWLVPSLELRARAGMLRATQMPFIPALDRRILESVAVEPIQAEVQLVAYWDLMPAVQASLDASNSRVYEASRVTARETQRRIRETLPPLWRRWAAEQGALWLTEPSSPRSAVRAVLQVAHLEAQLYALTGGAFPITKDTASFFYPKD